MAFYRQSMIYNDLIVNLLLCRQCYVHCDKTTEAITTLLLLKSMRNITAFCLFTLTAKFKGIPSNGGVKVGCGRYRLHAVRRICCSLSSLLVFYTHASKIL